MADKKEIFKPPKGEMTKFDDDYIVDTNQQFQDGILTIPRLKIVQKTSVEAEEIKVGSIVNSMDKKTLASPTKDKPAEIIIIPIIQDIGKAIDGKSIKSTYKMNRLFFHPVDEGGGIRCMSLDNIQGNGDPGILCANCEFARWPEKNNEDKKKSPPCSTVINTFCIVRDYNSPYPITASFMKTSTAAGKKLNQICTSARIGEKNLNAHDLAFKLFTKKYSKGELNWYQYEIEPAGSSEKEEKELAIYFHNLMKKSEVQIHLDEDEIKQEQTNMAEKEESTEGESSNDDEPPF